VPALLLAGLSAGCSLKSLAVGGLSGALSGTAEAFAREDDPEIVRGAMPFALKAIEGVLLDDPENEPLLSAASAGFGLYAYAFVQLDAERLQDTDYEAAEALRARAIALYRRARDYALRGLELRHAGITAALRAQPDEAVRALGKDDVELSYWAGGTWGLAISLGKDDPALLADLDAVRALLRRALELDEGYLEGALHEAMIPVEGLPAAMGGSVARARTHFQRALELSGGKRSSLYLKLAENVSVPAQDRAEFESLLRQALAVDLDAAPDQRLANRVSQARAAYLLDKIDDLFLPPLD